MYALGRGCADGPLYPWVSNTLKVERIIDPAKRGALLHLEAVTWLG